MNPGQFYYSHSSVVHIYIVPPREYQCEFISIIVISTATRTSQGVCSLVEEFGVLFVEAFSSYLLQLAHIRNTVGNSVVDIELNINNAMERAQGLSIFCLRKH